MFSLLLRPLFVHCYLSTPVAFLFLCHCLSTPIASLFLRHYLSTPTSVSNSYTAPALDINRENIFDDGVLKLVGVTPVPLASPLPGTLTPRCLHLAQICVDLPRRRRLSSSRPLWKPIPLSSMSRLRVSPIAGCGLLIFQNYLSPKFELFIY